MVMTRAIIAGAAVIVLLAFAAGHWDLEQDVDAAAVITPAVNRSTAEVHEGFLYGRVITDAGTAYEGRLRFGGDEETFWGHYFNGAKRSYENPWAHLVPRERLPQVRERIELFGIEIAAWDRPIDLGRPFMARLGDIARIEARGFDVRVTLKSGTVFDLDRNSANDFDDGVRVWDGRRGVVDLDSWSGGLPPPPRVQIRTIEFLPTARLSVAADRLYGTVRTRHGDFSGFVQWNRKQSVGSDELHGRTTDGELKIRFDAIRSIAHHSHDGALVTLRDGRQIVLSDGSEVGRRSGGMYVDDQRYGRVLISWDGFERVDFSSGGSGGSGPAYGEFAPGRPLTGNVITRSGRHLTGRLVYDLDESETTETLDAPSQGVDYMIPFDRIASIVLPDLAVRGTERARVRLRTGEQLQLALAGDLGDWNAGMLVFLSGHQRPEYVLWSDVAQVNFDSPAE
jgi:hypothetical protein